MEKANWNSVKTRLFCEICKEETQKGHRTGPYLNHIGCKNLEDKFFQATGKRLTKKQFRNKWDLLKPDFTKFMEVKKAATGLGWNEEKGTIAADDSWWDTHLQKHPDHAKFRKRGLENLECLESMFRDVYTTGENATIPVEPSIELIDDEDDGEDTDEEEVLVSSLKKTKKRKAAKSCIQDKEDKNPFLREFKHTMGKIDTSVEGSSTSVPVSNVLDMKAVLKMMVDCGAAEGTDLFFTSTK